MGDTENTTIIASKVIYTVENKNPGEINYQPEPVAEVRFHQWYDKAGCNLATAQKFCSEKGWALATADELRQYWELGYNPFKANGSAEGRLLPQLSVNSQVFSTNSPIQVSYTNGPGNTKDWVGIFPKEAKLEVTPTTITYELPTAKAFVKGASGTLEFSPPKEGDYFLAFFKDDSFLEMAERINISVTSKPQLFVNAFEFKSGSQVQVSYINGTGNPKDWVGVFPAGTTPGKGNPIGNWAYVEAPSGTLELSLPEEGAYFIAFFRDNSYEEVADRIDISVLNNLKPQLSVGSSMVYTGEPIKIDYSFAGPGTPNDWVGIFRQGVTPGHKTYVDWKYVNKEALTSGSLTLSVPTDGPYFIAFFKEDGYEEIAGRVNIYVGTGPRLLVASVFFEPQEPIQVTYDFGPVNAKDWVGIYRKGEIPGEVDATAWKYAAAASGMLEFSLADEDFYFIAFFKEDGYEEIARRIDITVAGAQASLPFAYGMLADGTFAVPVQQDYTLFKRGLNLGATGGNEGFFYVSARAVGKEAEAKIPEESEEQRPVQSQYSSSNDLNWLGLRFYASFGNYMMGQWTPLSRIAAMAYLRKKQFPVNQETIMQVAASVQADPVARYKFAPFLLKECFAALVAENPTPAQLQYKKEFERQKSEIDRERARFTLKAWKEYQNPQTSSYQPNTLSVLADYTTPSLEGFLERYEKDDPFKYGQKGGEAVAKLFYPMSAKAGLLDDYPLKDDIAKLGEDMTSVVIGAGIGSALSAPAVMIGSAFVYAKGVAAAAEKKILSSNINIIKSEKARAVGLFKKADNLVGTGVSDAVKELKLNALESLGKVRLKEKLIKEAGKNAIKKLLPKMVTALASLKVVGGVAFAMIGAAVEIGMAIADVVKKDLYRKKLEAQLRGSFSVAEFLDVSAGERENRRMALFTLMVKHLIAGPANDGQLTLELPSIEAITTAVEQDATTASSEIYPKVKFYAENGLTLDQARTLAQQNAWALATESDIRNAWTHRGLNLALYGLIADGRRAFPVQEDQSEFKKGPNIDAAGGNQGFFYIDPSDWSDEDPKEVQFHAQNSMSLAQAQAIGQQNFWSLATELQVREAWAYHKFDQFAFCMMADGRFALPLQGDYDKFKKGPNIGVTGGNQGFLYTEREVQFHAQNSMTLAEAQELAELNGWTLAAENEIQKAWQNGRLDVFAYGMMADGRIALPIQGDIRDFKKGPNIGITGGNQGFFYTV